MAKSLLEYSGEYPRSFSNLKGETFITKFMSGVTWIHINDKHSLLSFGGNLMETGSYDEFRMNVPAGTAHLLEHCIIFGNDLFNNSKTKFWNANTQREIMEFSFTTAHSDFIDVFKSRLEHFSSFHINQKMLGEIKMIEDEFQLIIPAVDQRVDFVKRLFYPFFHPEHRNLRGNRNTLNESNILLDVQNFYHQYFRLDRLILMSITNEQDGGATYAQLEKAIISIIAKSEIKIEALKKEFYLAPVSADEKLLIVEAEDDSSFFISKCLNMEKEDTPNLRFVINVIENVFYENLKNLNFVMMRSTQIDTQTKFSCVTFQIGLTSAGNKNILQILRTFKAILVSLQSLCSPQAFKNYQAEERINFLLQTHGSNIYSTVDTYLMNYVKFGEKSLFSNHILDKFDFHKIKKIIVELVKQDFFYSIIRKPTKKQKLLKEVTFIGEAIEQPESLDSLLKNKTQITLLNRCKVGEIEFGFKWLKGANRIMPITENLLAFKSNPYNQKLLDFLSISYSPTLINSNYSSKGKSGLWIERNMDIDRFPYVSAAIYLTPSKIDKTIAMKMRLLSDIWNNRLFELNNQIIKGLVNIEIRRHQILIEIGVPFIIFADVCKSVGKILNQKVFPPGQNWNDLLDTINLSTVTSSDLYIAVLDELKHRTSPTYFSNEEYKTFNSNNATRAAGFNIEELNLRIYRIVLKGKLEADAIKIFKLDVVDRLSPGFSVDNKQPALPATILSSFPKSGTAKIVTNDSVIAGQRATSAIHSESIVTFGPVIADPASAFATSIVLRLILDDFGYKYLREEKGLGYVFVTRLYEREECLIISLILQTDQKNAAEKSFADMYPLVFSEIKNMNPDMFKNYITKSKATYEQKCSSLTFDEEIHQLTRAKCFGDSKLFSNLTQKHIAESFQRAFISKEVRRLILQSD